MRKFFVLLLTAIVLIQCASDEAEQPQVTSCSIPATVRDLTGLDGCGFVFELQDGSRLEPLIVFGCGTPPLPDKVPADPIADFKWADGKKILIEYDSLPELSSACMAGQIVKITCITEVPSSQEDK